MYKEAKIIQIGIHAIFIIFDGPRGLPECTELHTSCVVLVVVEASAVVPLLLDFILEIEIDYSPPTSPISRFCDDIESNLIFTGSGSCISGKYIYQSSE